MAVTVAPIPVQSDSYAKLRMLGEMYEDHQATRIAQQGRIRSLAVVGDDYQPYSDLMEQEEKRLSKLLIQHLREIAPAGVLEWQRAIPGIGEHLLARLLGHLGHPRYAFPKYWEQNPTVASDEFGDAQNPKRALHAGEPFERTIGQLRQYCGHGKADRRRAGMTQEEAFALGKPSCKMLVHLLAESVVKAQVRNPHDPDSETRRESLGYLGGYYLTEKAKYSLRVHPGPCSGGFVPAGPGKVVFAKCKVRPSTVFADTHQAADGRQVSPSKLDPNTHSRNDGKTYYAQAGDPYSPGHVNAIALRHLGKEILKQLWLAAE